MSTTRPRSPSRRDRDAAPLPHHDPFERDPDVAAPPRTWWERHSITVMAAFSVVMLIFVITFQMAC